MSCGVFGNKTLNDNWFEDRVAPKWEKPETKLRKVETDLGSIESGRYEVLGRTTRKPHRPSYATPDYGTGSYKTSVTQDQFPPPASRKEVFVPEPKARFINDVTISEVCTDGKRPVTGPFRGWRAPLPRHEEGHGKVFFEATSKRAFAETEQEATDRNQRTSDMKATVSAGVPGCRDKEPPSLTLCGENESICNIPVQRSWMNAYDPGLTVLEKPGGRDPIPISKVDNHMSIAIGEGAQKEVQKMFEAKGGKFFRPKTVITSGKQTTDSINIFDDYPES